ncbi:MAG: SDR family NAD(P)-dependent oxidoreductase [Actinomycetota bacterium]
MSWTTNDIGDLTGKTAVITGANSGLGLESAKALARAGATVVMTARDSERLAHAADVVRSDVPAASIEQVQLDLAAQASIADAASSIADLGPSIDILMNNAGVMALPERATADGYEMQFGVNHLGHWTLTARLLPAVLAADAGRVVTVTSIARMRGVPIDPDNPHLRDGVYEPWLAYGVSKLANHHFALGLHQRLAAAGQRAISVSAHPGLSATNLQTTTVRESDGEIGAEWVDRAANEGMSADRGALSQIRAATDPSVRGGETYGPEGMFNGDPIREAEAPGDDAELDEAIATLWRVSESETGLAIDIPKA